MDIIPRFLILMFIRGWSHAAENRSSAYWRPVQRIHQILRKKQTADPAASSSSTLIDLEHMNDLLCTQKKHFNENQNLNLLHWKNEDCKIIFWARNLSEAHDSKHRKMEKIFLSFRLRLDRSLWIYCALMFVWKNLFTDLAAVVCNVKSFNGLYWQENRRLKHKCSWKRD